MSAMRPRKQPQIGELERAVLELLWTRADADVNETHVAVGLKRGISANTVGSALERLHRKGLVTRTRVSHAYRYKAAGTRAAFLGRQIAATLGDMRRLAGTGLLASLVDAVTETDKNSLAELEELIAKKRKEVS
jgi:predicted transcriptional regulator